MRKLFIDANIYLGFYNSNKPEFRKLLKSLRELSEKIFVTNQVIDEVNRNKLNVFRESIDNYLRQVSFVSTFLPEHLDAAEIPKIKEWNEKRKEFEKNALQLNKELNEIVVHIIEDISKSSDAVSAELSFLFKTPIKLQENTFKNAIHRREIGNPPGKVNDPIGDQLNWVQILENIEKVSELWIVTNDSDFFTEYDKRLYLNPLLYQELKSLNPKIEVFIFNKLSDALRSFNEKERVESLPTKEELDVISVDEPETYLYPSILDKMKGLFLGGTGAKPMTCAYCGAFGTLSNGEYLKSKLGGLTYQYVCSSCNNYTDTRHRPVFKS